PCSTHESCRRETTACLYSLSAVSKPPLRPARRYGTALRALALRGVGGPPSRGHHHARQSRGSTAGTCVVITYTAAVPYAGALIPGTRETQRGPGIVRAHFFQVALTVIAA